MMSSSYSTFKMLIFHVFIPVLQCYSGSPATNGYCYPNCGRLLQDLCAKLIEAAFNAAKPSTRHKMLLGKGSGLLWEASPYCSYATRDGVYIMFSGEVSEWPGGVNAVSAAHDGKDGCRSAGVSFVGPRLGMVWKALAMRFATNHSFL